MKLRIRIAHLLLVALAVPTVIAQNVPATGRALLISDIHLDPLADPAIISQLMEAPSSHWESILQSSTQKSLSTYKSDTNYPLFSSALAAAAAQAPFDYVVFTGDALRHTFLQAFVAAKKPPAQFPEFAAKTEAFVLHELQDRLKVPVLAALGNNDSGCGDYQIPPHDPFLDATADQLTVLTAAPEARSTFQLGGYYSISHPTVANQDIIVLNTIFWSTLYKSCTPTNGDPGEAELDWLGWKLYSARLLHHGVTLVMHIPPGMDAYSSSHVQCQSPVPFWQAKYAARFSALMSAYSGVVQMAFAGHTHMDDFRVSLANPPSLDLPSLPLRITPSVSPVFRNDPGFSVVTYSLTTASVSDITTFFLPLSSPAPLWSKEYQFDDAYSVGSFSAANLSAIAADISNGTGSDRASFEHEYAVSKPSPIRGANVPFYSCAQTNLASESYSRCVCAALPPGTHSPASVH